MSLALVLAWDRPASSGDSEHWLSVSLRGVPTSDDRMSLAVLVDTSTSMVGERLARARAGVAAVAQALRTGDSLLVLGFASEVRKVAEAAGGADLSRALAGLQAGGKTRLDLGLDEATGWLRSQPGRRHLLLVTDGDPTDADGRRVGGDPFVERARALGREGVRITVVGLGTTEGYDAGLLRSIADAAGGVAVVGVAASHLVDRTLAALRSGVSEQGEVALSVDSAELEVLEAWRVEPRVQPLPVVGGSTLFPAGGGAAVLLRTRLVQGLGGRRGERQVGTLKASLKGGAEVSARLVLHLVGPAALERTLLDADVDRLRVKVELARTAQLRAEVDDPDDQLRLTRRLADLAGQIDDPRATRRIQDELTRLAGGSALRRDEREDTVDVLRGGSGDG